MTLSSRSAVTSPVEWARSARPLAGSLSLISLSRLAASAIPREAAGFKMFIVDSMTYPFSDWPPSRSQSPRAPLSKKTFAQNVRQFSLRYQIVRQGEQI
jgi:hypothetical protein